MNVSRYGQKILNGGGEMKQSRPQNVRQRQIDNENNVLLTKIMGIMKRKNKSVYEARAS